MSMFTKSWVQRMVATVVVQPQTPQQRQPPQHEHTTAATRRRRHLHRFRLFLFQVILGILGYGLAILTTTTTTFMHRVSVESPTWTREMQLLSPTPLIHPLLLQSSQQDQDSILDKLEQLEQRLRLSSSVSFASQSSSPSSSFHNYTTTRRYYMYDLDDLIPPTVQTKLQDVIQLVHNHTCPFSNSYCADLEAEQFILQALYRHPLRCHDHDNCSKDDNNNNKLIHIIPLPVTALLAVDCNTLPDLKQCGQNRYRHHRHNQVTRALQTLQRHERFQYGHRHVLLSLRSRFFKGDAEGRPYQRYLNNITLANNFDPMACQQMVQEGTAGDYRPKYLESTPITKSNMVLGIGISGDLPLVTVSTSYKQWKQQRPNFIFYRTRVRPSAFGATPYRRAPITAVNWTTAFPSPSCVGYDLPAAQWLSNITHSQFCLVIRGDTPHSHSLLRAVRVGCIPVVISDHYQQYAGPFKSLVNITDFAISIPEAQFLAHPQRTLQQALQDQVLEDATYIPTKLHGLALAQKLLFPDHPDSLFVPAF